MKGILGRKIGMTEVFTKDGKVIPVTVIEVEPNVVTQIKTVETDGYKAIQLGVGDKKEKNATKASIGHFKKANTTPKRFLKEVRDYDNEYAIGDIIDVDIFNIGDVVDVTGTSKGKGTQGVIKRWGQKSGPGGHGSHYHRRPGSLGTMLPKRVLPGKKLPGRMGHETITIENLIIVDINKEEHYILVSGNVPGPKKSLVMIKTAAKNSRKSENIELISYSEEVAVEAPVADTPAVEEKIETPAVEETTNEVVTEQEEKAEEVVADTTAEEVQEEATEPAEETSKEAE